jgi:IS30 family transposase
MANSLCVCVSVRVIARRLGEASGTVAGESDRTSRSGRRPRHRGALTLASQELNENAQHRVLVCDDDPIAARILATILRRSVPTQPPLHS